MRYANVEKGAVQLLRFSFSPVFSCTLPFSHLPPPAALPLSSFSCSKKGSKPGLCPSLGDLERVGGGFNEPVPSVMTGWLIDGELIRQRLCVCACI